MEVASNITQHTIVLCVEKRERGIGIESMLSQSGFKVILAVSLYDALKYISQDMPHLVITEATLSDGTAIALYDRLQQHPTLKLTPVMVTIQKKTREELQQLAQRKFAGFFLGSWEPKPFLAKVLEIIKSHSQVSPYFVPANASGIGEDLMISIEAAVMGKTGEQLISRSNTEVDAAASLVCVPNSPGHGPAILRMATNLREGEEIFNLFPINRIVGVGRKWVEALPDIKAGSDKAKQSRKVLLHDPAEQRLESFREILKGYDIEVLPAKSLALAASILKREGANIGCVYLHELMNDSGSIEWKNVYSKMPMNQKPPLIIGTSSMNTKPTPGIRYIKRPFGMGVLIEMLESSFERSSDLAENVGKNAKQTAQGFPVRFQAPAKLIGIDETGGVLMLKYPLIKGSKLCLNHKFLESAWGGQNMVQITAASTSDGKNDIWYARFEAVSVGMSKVKYWDRISKALGDVQATAAPIEKAS